MEQTIAMKVNSGSDMLLPCCFIYGVTCQAYCRYFQLQIRGSLHINQLSI
jgi:hypothetical protein